MGLLKLLGKPSATSATQLSRNESQLNCALQKGQRSGQPAVGPHSGGAHLTLITSFAFSKPQQLLLCCPTSAAYGPTCTAWFRYWMALLASRLFWA